MRLKLSPLPFLFLFLNASPALAQSDPSTEALIRAIETGLGSPVEVAGRPATHQTLLATMHKYQVPAVSVAVIHDGKVAWAKGYGRLPENGALVNSETLFQAASLSKSFAAMAALRLVEDGMLSLDAPVGPQLKSWALPANAFTSEHPVTLRGLLSHTAGINVHGFSGYAAGAALPTLLQVLNGEKPANSDAVVVEALPGTKFSYSGGGFMIAQQMMFDATGKSYPQLMKTLLLDPIGMTHSTFEQPLPAKLVINVALPVDDKGKPIAGGAHVYPEMAAAGLWTTPTDLAKWMLEVQQSLNEQSSKQSHHVLSPAMTRQMLTPVLDTYALGVDTTRTAGAPAFTHTGGNEGYRAIYFAYENGDGAVILTNGSNGASVFRKLMRSIANAYHWPDFKTIKRTELVLAPAALKQYVGKFDAKDFGPIEIRLQDGRLEMKTDEPFTPLLAASATAFFTVDHSVAVEVVFESADKGKLSVGGQDFVFNREK